MFVAYSAMKRILLHGSQGPKWVSAMVMPLNTVLLHNLHIIYVLCIKLSAFSYFSVPNKIMELIAHSQQELSYFVTDLVRHKMVLIRRKRAFATEIRHKASVV